MTTVIVIVKVLEQGFASILLTILATMAFGKRKNT